MTLLVRGVKCGRPSGGDQFASTRGTAPSAFDVAWAQEVLGETLRIMQRECRTCGRTDVWGVFEARLIGPILHDEQVVPYEQLVDRYNLATPRRASNALITGKRMFVRILRSVVGRYTPADEIESEIQQLQELLARGAG